MQNKTSDPKKMKVNIISYKTYKLKFRIQKLSTTALLKTLNF